MFADLHLHTDLLRRHLFAGGDWWRRPARFGLTAIGLDGPRLGGRLRAHGAACAAAGIEFIAGTELTAEQDGNELHLLGYFIDTQNPGLLAEIARFQAVRQNRIREMVARLNQLKVPLLAEAVFALANCRSPGRPHVARALVQAGFCRSLDEAFERFLKKNRPAWVPEIQDGEPRTPLI